MTKYCKTITEQNGRRTYGIDLVEYIDGERTIHMSRPDITDDWQLICKITRYANTISVPENLFDEFLEVMME